MRRALICSAKLFRMRLRKSANGFGSLQNSHRVIRQVSIVELKYVTVETKGTQYTYFLMLQGRKLFTLMVTAEPGQEHGAFGHETGT
jgi:hypothetical protein